MALLLLYICGGVSPGVVLAFLFLGIHSSASLGVCLLTGLGILVFTVTHISSA